MGRQESGAILDFEGIIIQDEGVRTWFLDDVKLYNRLFEISNLAIAISKHQGRPVEIEGCYTPFSKEPTLFQLREVELPEADPNFKFLPLRNRIVIGESTYCVSERSFRERGTLVVPESISVSVPHVKAALKELGSKRQFVYEVSRQASLGIGLNRDTGIVVDAVDPSVYLTGTLNPTSHAVQGGYFAGNGTPICEIDLNLTRACQNVGGCRIYDNVMIECDKTKMRVTVPNGSA